MQLGDARRTSPPDGFVQTVLRSQLPRVLAEFLRFTDPEDLLGLSLAIKVAPVVSAVQPFIEGLLAVLPWSPSVPRPPAPSGPSSEQLAEAAAVQCSAIRSHIGMMKYARNSFFFASSCVDSLLASQARVLYASRPRSGAVFGARAPPFRIPVRQSAGFIIGAV